MSCRGDLQTGSDRHRSDESSGDDVPSDQVEEAMGDDTLMDEGSSSSDEEEEESTGRPYNELLELLHANADSKGPARKRRKIASDAKEEAQPATVAVEENAEQDEDALQDQAPSDEEEEAQEDGDDDDPVGPFEKHFNLPGEKDLTKAVDSIKANKWAPAKKETNGLRFVQSTPDGVAGDGALLPAMKSTANLKVRSKLTQMKWLYEPY